MIELAWLDLVCDGHIQALANWAVYLKKADIGNHQKGADGRGDLERTRITVYDPL